MAGAEREVVGTDKGHTNKKGNTYGEYAGEYDITVPTTDAAKTWLGWNVSLKPAFEPIIVAMKPRDKSKWIIRLTPGLLDEWEAEACFDH